MSGSTYRAPLWLPGGHAQTVYPRLIPPPLPPLRRERWDTPDGDFIDVDHWALGIQHGSDRPRIILFHGLEGSSRSPYARALLRAASRAGTDACVAHFRGCSGEANRLPRAYHSGDSKEVGWVLERLKQERPGAPLFAVGVSLGANALLKCLGERGTSAGRVVEAAAAICAPIDLMAAGLALERGFCRVYTHHFLRTLKRSADAKLTRFPGLFDRSRMLAARTLREFDDVVTAPIHGFKDWRDYWTRASSKPVLPGIRVPTLLLNPLNDPFLPAHVLPGTDLVSRETLREFPSHGGHVGFVSGTFPGHLDWLPERVLAFFGLPGHIAGSSVTEVPWNSSGNAGVLRTKR